MSQVRILSDANDGSYSQNFKEEISFPANAKIALNTFTMNTANKSVTINANNDLITFIFNEIEDDGTITDTYTINYNALHGVYNTEATILTLINDINQKLNEDTFNDGTDFTNSISLIANAGEGTFNRFTLQLFQVRAGLYESLQVLKNAEKKTITGNNFFQSTDTNNTAGFTNYIAYSVPLQSGKGRFYLQPSILQDSGEGNQNATIGTNGILLGLSEKEPKADGSETYALSDIKYGIYINNENSEYRTIASGAETNSGVSVIRIDSNSPENNDFISLEKVGKNILCKLYSPHANSTQILATIPITNVLTELYPVVIFKGKGTGATNTGAKVRILAYTPFLLFPDENLVLGNHTTPRLGNDPRDPERSDLDIVLSMNFSSLVIAELLGFKKNDNPMDDETQSLVAPNLMNPFVPNDYYVVVIDTLKIDNYDGKKQGRANVLSYIPRNDNLNSVVEYEPNNLYFVNLNNKDPFKIRNISGRILDIEMNPIQTQGLFTFSFLIN